MICIGKTKCASEKGLLRSSYFLFKEWNKIPLDIRNSESVGIFKKCVTLFNVITIE